MHIAHHGSHTLLKRGQVLKQRFGTVRTARILRRCLQRARHQLLHLPVRLHQAARVPG